MGAQVELRKMAADIISQVTRDKPADFILRQESKRLGRKHAESTQDLSRMVFDYFRWRGWLNRAESLEKQVAHARRLAAQFSAAPEVFRDSELVQKAVPGWLGRVMEVSPAWARFIQREPVLWLRARAGKGRAVSKALNSGSGCASGGFQEALRFSGEIDLFRTAEFRAGDFEIQDLSSQAVGIICGPRPGETWWDACAGEGGKLLHLSDLMRNRGLVWASDRSHWRLRKLKQRAARAGVFNYRMAPWNGGVRLPTKTLFDGVLVDAPCSGVGTWQRNPHARWTTTVADVEELSEVQKQLLKNAAKALKPGGKLVYSVCTLTYPETRDVVAWFENQCPDLIPLPIRNPFRPELPGKITLVVTGEQSESNGMFIACWQRESAAAP